MRRPRRAKLKTTEKVLVICEGETDECYISQLLKEYGLITANVTVASSSGGGYTNTKNYIERNGSLYSIILVVCDLDRAAHKDIEKRNLKSLINHLERENPKNNVFLNNPEIEVWIAANIGVSADTLQELGYEKGNTVCRFIREHKGSYEKACKQFADAELYFEKRGFGKGIYKEEAISTPHSNLVYFVDYMEILIRK